MRYQYTTIDRIFTKIARDLGEDYIKNEEDIIEWTGEALEHTQSVKSYEEAVAVMEISNHQAELPSGLHAIIQIARNNRWDGRKKEDKFCPAKVIEEITGETPYIMTEDGCTECGEPATGKRFKPDYILLDCNGLPIDDYEIAYYRPFYSFNMAFGVFSGSAYYKQHFTPVRLADNSLYDSIVCQHPDNCGQSPTEDRYTVVDRKILRFDTIKDGQIVMAYLRQSVDPKTGYPHIPDHISYTSAIVAYITWKLMTKEFIRGIQGAEGRMKESERQWEWYCAQATNVDKMPYGIDEHQDLLEQRSYLVPRRNDYYSFFGKLSRPERNRYFNQIIL